jgi:hypothetical protein
MEKGASAKRCSSFVCQADLCVSSEHLLLCVCVYVRVVGVHACVCVIVYHRCNSC